MRQQTVDHEFVLVADSRVCRLLRAHRPRGGRLELEQIASATAPDLPTVEHGRPSPRINKDGHSYASRSHQDDEHIRALARRIAELLAEHWQERDSARLWILAPPRLLGQLRKTVVDGFAGEIVEHVGEFANLPTTELERHPVAAGFCAPRGIEP